MGDSFDPYLQWLGIRDLQRPPNHYRLLGIELFENDPDVISHAADRQMAHVRTFQSGRHGAASQQLLNELAAAKICLLNPQKKSEYDSGLWAQQPPPAIAPPSAGTSYAGPVPVDVTRPPPLPPPPPSLLGRGPVRTALAIGLLATLLVVLLGGLAMLVNLAAPQTPGEPSKVGPAPSVETLVPPGDAPRPATPTPVASKPSERPSQPVTKAPGAQARPAPGPPAAPAPQGAQPVKTQAPPSPLPKPLPVQSGLDPALAAAGGGRSAAELFPLIRQAMRAREMALARRLLDTADKNVFPKDRAECDRLREAFTVLDAFWTMVRRNMAAMQPGELFTWSGGTAQVVQASAEAIELRGATQERYTIATLPVELALALAERRLSDPSMALAPKIALFGLDAHGNLQQALELSRQPGTKGLVGAGLLAELTQAGAPAGPPAAPRQPARLPVPPEAEQVAARREIRQVFREGYAKSQRPPEKGALAEQLFKAAAETKDNPTARYVLLTEARDQALGAAYAKVLHRVLAEMAAGYEVDLAAETARAFRSASEMASPMSVKKDLAGEAARLAREAVARDEFDLAAGLAQAAYLLGLKGRDATTARAAKALADEMPERRARAEAAQQAALTLARSPDDPQANQVQGEYLCFHKDRWREGLPMLAKGGDPALKALAQAELPFLNSSPDPAEMIRLGDLWLEGAKAAPSTLADRLRARAGIWYRRALPATKGFTKARLERLISQIEDY